MKKEMSNHCNEYSVPDETLYTETQLVDKELNERGEVVGGK
nr:hypothetical protein [Domibacillus epiphyticus]